MRLHTLICIFGSIFVDHVTADGFDSDLPSPIKQLDAYNYEKTIKETKIILVEFFAPWVTVKIMFYALKISQTTFIRRLK